MDYFRPKTPLRIKQQIISYIDSRDAVLCEPTRFEILRASFRNERSNIEAVFATIPMVQTPGDLWDKSSNLGQKCVEAGFTVPAIDLLIAQIALHHRIELITFDSHFDEIAKVLPLKVRLLQRGS